MTKVHKQSWFNNAKRALCNVSLSVLSMVSHTEKDEYVTCKRCLQIMKNDEIAKQKTEGETLENEDG